MMICCQLLDTITTVCIPLFPNRILFQITAYFKFQSRYFIFGLMLSYVNCALPYLEPEFLPSASNVTYSRGDLAILFCAVKNLGSQFVSWRKTSEPNPLTVGTLIYVPDSRLRVSYIEYRGEWNLYINNVSHSDAGLYECQVSTQMRDMRKYILLNVKDSPITTTTKEYYKKDDVIISGPVTVDVGNELFVTCNVSTAGYNQDLFSIEWFIGGNVVDSGDDRFNITKEISDYYMQSTLTIKHATKKDRAEYLCRTTSKQVGRQHIFVLDSEKSSTNTKRRTDRTNTLKASSKTKNGQILLSANYCLSHLSILIYIINHLIR